MPPPEKHTLKDADDPNSSQPCPYEGGLSDKIIAPFSEQEEAKRRVALREAVLRRLEIFDFY